jgi:hypothetical protein
MKLAFTLPERPCADVSTNEWFRVQKNNGDCPFKFKDSHPNRFHPTDFAVWAAYHPKAARRYFSPVLMNVFEYSWKTLAEMTGEKPKLTLPSFAESIKDYPWLLQEFRLWGNLFSYLFIGKFEKSPLIYKTLSPSIRSFQVSKPWRCQDGVTPKLYSFEELAFQKRWIIAEQDDTDIRLRDIEIPNIGNQYFDDSSTLVLLIEGMGFDEKGHLSFLPLHR